MVRTIISIVLIFVLATGCFKFDDFLYNPNQHPISEYKLQHYTGEVDFRLQDSIPLADSMVHLFTLTSKLNNDIKKIYAVYIGDTNRIATDTVILYCHGNKDHLDFYFPRIHLLGLVGGQHRYGVMSFDYRGFGLSEGTPSEDGLYADTEAAILWLKQHGLTDDRLIIYGFSMGTAPATKLTAHYKHLKPSKIILEAPFASAEVFYQDAVGLALPGSYVMNLKIENAKLIQQVQQPFLWIHGISDDFIYIKTHGEVVFKNYRGTKKYGVRVPEANHSDIQLKLGFRKYTSIIHQFITNQLNYNELVQEN